MEFSISRPNLGTNPLTRASSVRVDVGQKVLSPVIIRGGEEILAPQVDKGRVDDMIANYIPQRRRTVPRGVAQSIPAGTFVARGTPIDVTLVPVTDIGYGILENAHLGFAERSIDDMLDLVQQPDIERALKKRAVGDVTETERNAIVQALGEREISVTEDDPAQSFERAFETLKQTRAFL